MATIEQISTLFDDKLGKALDGKLGLKEGETLDSKLDDKLNSKLGLKEGETLDSKLGLKEGETLDSKLDDKLNSKLGLKEGETLNDKFNQTFSDKLTIDNGESVNLPKMQQQLGALLASSPDAVLKDLAPNLAGAGSAIVKARAVSNGALSTWTFMKAGTQKLAVGAAHCALPYRLVPGQDPRLENLEFVEIPQELCGLVTRVGILRGYHSRHAQDRDLAVLMLNDFPSRINPSLVPEWAAFESTPDAQSKVGGLTLTGSVRGHGCVGGMNPIIKFVEDSGEAGNSGALMFAISPHDGEKTVIGVYLGTARKNAWASFSEYDQKARGRILKLPELDGQLFEWFPCVETPLNPGETFMVNLPSGRNTTKSIKVTQGISVFKTLPAGERCFGVFVRKPSS